MSRTIHVFISSKMMELKPEREALGALIPTLGDETLNLHPWVFEDDATASASSIRQVYLQALDESELYIGLFWNDYGEYTIDEFHRATERGITRHIYVKNVDADQRDPRLTDFLNQQSDVRFGLTPRWFSTVDELREQVRRAISQWLTERQIAYHSTTSAVVATIEDDIPDLPRKLIGRGALIGRVSDLLTDHERVLLRGFGGTGKTALAATIAADWLDNGGQSVIWLRAGVAPADALFEAIARAFDAQAEIAGTTGDARVQAIKHILAAQKNALLVLDDAWNGQALATLTKALPRRMPFLVTSRQRFPLDEIIEVGELEPADARKLLTYHARTDISDTDATRLCDLLGNHAFALEIAGKTLKVYAMTPATLIDKIESAPHDIQMPFGFGELGRVGIKSLLDASIDALTKPQYDIFVLLGGMFEPTASPELVERALNESGLDVAGIMNALAERGLLNARQEGGLPYYRLHDLAYSYARTLFTGKGLSHEPIIAACRAYVTDYHQDLHRIDVEQSNILEAAEAAAERNNDETLLDIMLKLAVQGPYLAARGYHSLALSLTQTAATVAEATHQPEAAHHLYSKLGNAYGDHLGDWARADAAYSQALSLAETCDLTARKAILLTVLGKVRFHQGDASFSDLYAEAESIARELNDSGTLAFVLHHRGYQAHRVAEQATARGDEAAAHDAYETARSLSIEAAQLAETVGAVNVQFHSLIVAGGSELELREIETAIETHKRALSIADLHEHIPWQAQSHQALGEDYHYHEQRDAAQTHFDEALRLWHLADGKANIRELEAFMIDHDYAIHTR